MQPSIFNAYRMHLIITYLAFMFATAYSCAVEWSGKCIHVADGDNITVMYHELPLKVRLYGIDAPERHQDFGTRARQHLRDLVHDKTVSIDFMGFDSYNRALGIVYVEEVNVNEEMLTFGMAWIFTRYCPDPHLSRWLPLEKKSREEGIGLWSHKSPTPPWEFRNSKKNVRRNKDNP